MNNHIRRSVDRARRFAAHGDEAAAKQAYLDVLRVDPTYFPALIELGALACASGHRSAARTAYAQAVHYHPGNPIGRVNLGNLLFEDGDVWVTRAALSGGAWRRSRIFLKRIRVSPGF